MQIELNKGELELVHDLLYLEFTRIIADYKKIAKTSQEDAEKKCKGLIDKLCPVLDTLADAREELYKKENKNETV